MFLAEYFKNTQGVGVLATSDCDGMVDLALYAKPHVADANTVAFVMRQRLTHQNLKSNIHAAYMFIENGTQHNGLRLYLTKKREETNVTLVQQLIKENPNICPENDDSQKFIVFFNIESTSPLVGDPK